MISLGTTPEQMLAEIGAGPFDPRRTDPGDPRLVSDELASVVFSGIKPEDVLPALRRALTARFAHVSPDHLIDDLIKPLKKGVGNAYRRGNLKDKDKRITIKVSVSPRGAVLAVSDEGAGFDFTDVLERLRSDEKYFERKGSGFSKFQRSRSLISFADGGRTFLCRFLCDLEPGRPSELVGGKDLGRAGDGDFMAAALAARLPSLRDGSEQLEGCRVFLPAERHEQWDVKYELRCRSAASGEERTVVLTGIRVPADEGDAWLATVSALREVLDDGVAVPEAVAVLDDPLLVLFAFNPDRDLRRLLKNGTEAAAAAHLAQVGSCLRRLHGSTLPLAEEPPLRHFARHAAVARDVIATLEDHDPDLARRVERVAREVERRVAALAICPSVPIHGDFGWNRIIEGERHLYLVGFHDFCRGHPGFDLGAVVADLLRFYEMRDREEAGQRAAVQAALLDAYGDGRPPAWLADLDAFVGAILLLRLGRLLARPQKKWAEKVGPLVELCERCLDGGA